MLLAALLAVVLGWLAPQAAEGRPARPVVTGLSVHSGPAYDGGWVTVVGQHLQQVSSVYFGTYRVAASSATSTHVRVQTPYPKRDVTVSVRVRTLAGTYSAVTAKARYTFVKPPVLTALSAHQILPAGRRLTVYGQEFRSVRSVTFSGVQGSKVAVASSTRLTVTAPAHKAGLVYVTVTTAYGRTYPQVATAGDDRDASALRYAGPPTISSVTANGTAAGGETVTVNGSAFTNASSVTFGGTRGSGLSVVSDHQVTVRAPAHAAGSVDVRVTTPSGTSAVQAADRFVFVPVNPDVWQATHDFDRFRGDMSDISCADDTHCVAVDQSSAVARDGAGWESPHPIAAVGAHPAVSCPTTTFCAVTAGRTVVTYRDGAWSAPVSVADSALTDISCAGVGSCTALGTGTDGLYVLSGGSWSGPIHYPSTLTLPGYPRWVTCPTTTCLVANDSGEVASYDGSTWSAVQRVDDTSSVAGLECASPTACVLADQDGDVTTLDASGWGPRTDLYPGEDILHVGCARGGLCAVTTNEENAAVFDGAIWQKSPRPIYPAPTVSHDTVVQAVTCASATTCVAVDAAGDSITYAAGTWSAPVPDFVSTASMDALSCPSSDFCAAADTDGNAFVRRSGTWSEPVPVHRGYLLHAALSCTSATFCLLLLSDGTAATWNGTQWSEAPAPDAAWTSVSCVAGPRCSTGDETFDGSAWRPTGATPAALGLADVSCASAAFCAAAGNGRLSVWNGTAWSAPAGDGAGSTGYYHPDSVSCPTADFCLAAANSGHLWVYRGGSWSLVGSERADGLSVSCTSSTFCQITSVGWAAWVWTGSGLTESATLPYDATYRGGPQHVACTSVDRCVALGVDTEYVSARG